MSMSDEDLIRIGSNLNGTTFSNENKKEDNDDDDKDEEEEEEEEASEEMDDEPVDAERQIDACELKEELIE